MTIHEMRLIKHDDYYLTYQDFAILILSKGEYSRQEDNWL